MFDAKASAEELKWQGRNDARTLAEAEAIKQNKPRLANAQKEAQNILAEKNAELRGLSKVAKQPAVSVGPLNKKRDMKRNSFIPFGGFPTTPTM